VLDLLVENGEGDFVGAMVFTERHIADFGVGADGAALGFDENVEHLTHVARIGGEIGVGAAGNVGKLADVARQGAAELVDSRGERLEVIAVLDARVFDDLFQPFSIEPDRVHAENGVVIERSKFGAGGSQQLIDEHIYIDARLLHDLSGDFPHEFVLSSPVVGLNFTA
jgi:hypothetical protein